MAIELKSNLDDHQLLRAGEFIKNNTFTALLGCKAV